MRLNFVIPVLALRIFSPCARSLENSFVRFNYSKLEMIILGIGKKEDIFEEEKNYWVNERNVPSNLKTCQSATEILIVGFSKRNFF